MSVGDFDYVLNILNNLPKFYDEREDILKDLKNFIIERYPPKFIKKYEYLATSRKYVPEDLFRLSLKKFN